MKESATASHIRLAAAQNGVHLWRNNSGAFQNDTGRWVRFGLGNDSKKISDVIKSSDFIGGTPVVVTPDMVGQTVLILTAVETKPSGWKLIPSDSRGLAQQNFHDIIKKLGGYAGFASTVEQFLKIVKK